MAVCNIEGLSLPAVLRLNDPPLLDDGAVEGLNRKVRCNIDYRQVISLYEVLVG